MNQVLNDSEDKQKGAFFAYAFVATVFGIGAGIMYQRTFPDQIKRAIKDAPSQGVGFAAAEAPPAQEGNTGGGGSTQLVARATGNTAAI